MKKAIALLFAVGLLSLAVISANAFDGPPVPDCPPHQVCRP